MKGNFILINMRKNFTKSIAFIMFLFMMVFLNIHVFRSNIPHLIIITLIGSVVVFIYFPYNRFFNNKKQN